MTNNLLDQLRTMTAVVADSGDFEAIREFKPVDATANPSLITAAAQMPEYQSIIDETVRQAKKDAGSGASKEQIVSLALDRVAVAFGRKALEVVPGRVSTQGDARLVYDTEATVKNARFLMSEYEKAGVPRERVMIKVAATWEGIRAAEILEKEDIRCNMTLLFAFHQAVACAEVGATMISPYVGRIMEWYKKETGSDSYPADEDPGVVAVTKMYNYFRKFGYKTAVMAASFRNIGEVTELAGLDLMTITLPVLTELKNTEGHLVRKLYPEKAATVDIEKMTIDQATYEAMHAADRQATENLNNGIAGFIKAQETLEALLAERLAKMESGRASAA
jgi:transaldolase